jgi:hypothetical protein
MVAHIIANFCQVAAEAGTIGPAFVGLPELIRKPFVLEDSVASDCVGD